MVIIEKSFNFSHKGGFIHTAELRICKHEDTNPANLKDKRRPKRITSVHSCDACLTAVFNPNHEGFVSKQSGEWREHGECFSLSDFQNILKKCISEKEISLNAVSISRVDFAFDCFNPSTAAVFKKLSDLLITALVVKHNISRKDQYCTTDIIRRKPKSICARTKPKHFEFTCYDKETQLPEREALWRLELRYLKHFRKKDENQKTVRDMLMEIADEIQSLKKWRLQTQEVLAKELAQQFFELQQTTAETLNANQFIAQNGERFFSREQIRSFLRLIGYSEKIAWNGAKNFSDRYKHLYINGNQFNNFIDMLIMQIKKYINNDAQFNL